MRTVPAGPALRRCTTQCAIVKWHCYHHHHDHAAAGSEYLQPKRCTMSSVSSTRYFSGRTLPHRLILPAAGGGTALAQQAAACTTDARPTSTVENAGSTRQQHSHDADGSFAGSPPSGTASSRDSPQTGGDPTIPLLARVVLNTPSSRWQQGTAPAELLPLQHQQLRWHAADGLAALASSRSSDATLELPAGPAHAGQPSPQLARLRSEELTNLQSTACDSAGTAAKPAESCSTAETVVGAHEGRSSDVQQRGQQAAGAPRGCAAAAAQPPAAAQATASNTGGSPAQKLSYWQQRRAERRHRDSNSPAASGIAARFRQSPIPGADAKVHAAAVPLVAATASPAEQAQPPAAAADHGGSGSSAGGTSALPASAAEATPAAADAVPSPQERQHILRQLLAERRARRQQRAHPAGGSDVGESSTASSNAASPRGPHTSGVSSLAASPAHAMAAGSSPSAEPAAAAEAAGAMSAGSGVSAVAPAAAEVGAAGCAGRQAVTSSTPPRRTTGAVHEAQQPAEASLATSPRPGTPTADGAGQRNVVPRLTAAHCGIVTWCLNRLTCAST